jgi:hypothetical protein
MKHHLGAIRDEIRKVMAIHGLWKVYRKPQMKIKDIHARLEEIFHGNEKTGVVAQVHQVLGGYYPFDALFTQQTSIVVSGSTDPNNNITNLVLRNDLTQSEVVYMVGREITQGLLETTFLSKPELIRGRKLYNNAKVALRNIRKAVAILKELPEVSFVDNEIQFASGVSMEEVKEKLLDGMYVYLTSTPTNGGDDSDCEGAEENTGTSTAKNRTNSDMNQKRPNG